jgi:hypothetical protein
LHAGAWVARTQSPPSCLVQTIGAAPSYLEANQIRKSACKGYCSIALRRNTLMLLSPACSRDRSWCSADLPDVGRFSDSAVQLS